MHGFDKSSSSDLSELFKNIKTSTRFTSNTTNNNSDDDDDVDDEEENKKEKKYGIQVHRQRRRSGKYCTFCLIPPHHSDAEGGGRYAEIKYKFDKLGLRWQDTIVFLIAETTIKSRNH